MKMEYPWNYHVDAALKGINQFRAFLERLNQSGMHVITLPIQNGQPEPIHLFVEPVAEAYYIPSGETYEVVVLYWPGAAPSIVVAQDEVTVWGADLWGMEVFHNGVTLFDPGPNWTSPEISFEDYMNSMSSDPDTDLPPQ